MAICEVFSVNKKEHLKLLTSLYLPNYKKFHPVLNDTKMMKSVKVKICTINKQVRHTKMMKSVKVKICTINKQVP